MFVKKGKHGLLILICKMVNKYRENLIRFAFEFYISCLKINEIKRIALVGSILTQKEKPKDVDLLLTIPDDLDLTRLAMISRRLQGKAGGISGGADIFLTNEEMEYIGRICEWKDCRPGIRVRCDALNCGKREYLHDDLSTVKLKKELIENPPLVLFPSLILNVSVPIDVEEGLLKKIF